MLSPAAHLPLIALCAIGVVDFVETEAAITLMDSVINQHDVHISDSERREYSLCLCCAESMSHAWAGGSFDAD